MEDNKQDQSNAPSSGNVMDVQQPVASVPPDSNPTPPAPGSQPEKPKQGGLSPDLLAQAQAEVQKPNAKSDGKPAAPKAPGKKGPKLVVALAVVVALALSGVAVYAYMQSQDKSHDSSNTSNHEDGGQGHENEDATPASAKDVEDAAHELDETVNATNEAEEIPNGGLSEEQVGL